MSGDSNSQQSSKSIVSDPSKSIDEVNVPEVTDISAKFIYNFYTADERVAYPATSLNQMTSGGSIHSTQLPLEKIARYISISWKKPEFSFLIPNEYPALTIGANSTKIVSEDNFFNPGYVNHTFSNVAAIQQGATDLENISRIYQYDTESTLGMAKIQIRNISDGASTENASLLDLTDAYTRLADFPKSALGLKFHSSDGQSIDSEGDLLRSLTDSISLNMKINCSVISDIFQDSSIKSVDSQMNALSTLQANTPELHRTSTSKSLVAIQNESFVQNKVGKTANASPVGYIIDKYTVANDGFTKVDTFYVENIDIINYVDKKIQYGLTYAYSIRVVASIKMLTYRSYTDNTVDMSLVYVSSRATTAAVECHEQVPPPEPNDIKFIFNHSKRNLTITWDTPVNSQNDIKQYQVFRRKSIREPFELIAQYGFDTSLRGPGISGRYTTGENVDANNIQNMSTDYKYLVYSSEYPVRFHVDEDFTVDTEFFISSEYIYAVCAIDAHGMISNYSSQYYVTFDPYRNRLVTNVICDAGSPRQYPNMNLRMDAFKDVIKVSGDAARQMSVYFSPEYLKVKDDKNASLTYNIVEAQTTSNTHSYYLLQLINLDNQKIQTLKINIKDPQGLTLQ